MGLIIRKEKEKESWKKIPCCARDFGELRKDHWDWRPIESIQKTSLHSHLRIEYIRRFEPIGILDRYGSSWESFRQAIFRLQISCMLSAFFGFYFSLWFLLFRTLFECTRDFCYCCDHEMRVYLFLLKSKIKIWISKKREKTNLISLPISI